MQKLAWTKYQKKKPTNDLTTNQCVRIRTDAKLGKKKGMLACLAEVASSPLLPASILVCRGTSKLKLAALSALCRNVLKTRKTSVFAIKALTKDGVEPN